VPKLRRKKPLQFSGFQESRSWNISVLPHDHDVTYRQFNDFSSIVKVVAPQVTMASLQSERLLPPCADWLHDGTRKVLPTMFAILFIIAASVVIIYLLSIHQPTPDHFWNSHCKILMLIRNFFLYACMQMRLIRSASGSDRIVRVEGKRKPWHVRLVLLLDRPRNFVRGYALKKV
jgi:hypothetical protein